MILVTGGAGYIGSRMVPILLQAGHAVRLVDTLWFGRSLADHPNLEVIQADLLNCDSTWFRDVDTIIHLAGLSNDVTADFAPEQSWRSNALASEALARTAAAVSDVGQREIRCLFASTCSVYYSVQHASDTTVVEMDEESIISPMATYSRSKREAEVSLLAASLHHPRFVPVLLRMGTIFGISPRMRFDLVVNTFTLSSWCDRKMTLHGSAEVWRPVLHLDDAIDAYLHLLSQPSHLVRGQTFNVVCENLRISALAAHVAETLRIHRGVQVDVVRDDEVDNGSRSYSVNAGKIEQMLGFRARRDVANAVLSIWDALDRGDFGPDPRNNSRFFNIRWLMNGLLAREEDHLRGLSGFQFSRPPGAKDRSTVLPA